MSGSERSPKSSTSEGDYTLRPWEPVLVYCRVRPLQSIGDTSNVIIKDPTTIALSSPAAGNGTHQKQKEMKHEMHYVFKQVFGPKKSQHEVYQTVARPLVERLIRGHNSLLFTYGVTGSGKTYTMTGDAKELGLMPRCLETLFRTISGFHARKSIFQTDHLNGFEIVSETEANARQKAEKYQKPIKVSNRISSAFDLSSLQNITPLSGIDERNVYAVFISYTEIYNNCVYDLLEECSIQKTLQTRIVREDANHNMYIHGVTEIEINSVQEAMEAFLTGQNRKRIGHTMLNAESSRSHAIFNIRLVQAPIGQHAKDDKRIITVSQLSLVDLAGSERSSRTKNTGARLREAGNINNTLMTLRTCLEYLRENQQAPPGSISKKIPYRDSKITQLFKNFFEGEGQVSMIACINPSMEDYNENAQVMKFAEITQEVQVPCAATVCVTNSDNDVVNSLSTKFFGCEVEGPIGDGPLSEKLVNFFEQHLEKHKKASNKMETQCDDYRSRILELEKENEKLRMELENLRILYKEECQRGRLMEETVSNHKNSLALLQERLQSQETRLNFIMNKPKVCERSTYMQDSLEENCKYNDTGGTIEKASPKETISEPNRSSSPTPITKKNCEISLYSGLNGTKPSVADVVQLQSSVETHQNRFKMEIAPKVLNGIKTASESNETFQLKRYFECQSHEHMTLSPTFRSVHSGYGSLLPTSRLIPSLGNLQLVRKFMELDKHEEEEAAEEEEEEDAPQGS